MAVSIALIVFFICFINVFECKKVLVEEKWWGPDDLRGWNDTSIRPFKIVFEEDMIQDLRNRLWSYRPSKPTLPHVGFEYGFNTRELPAWINYWANEYPFQEREDFLNQFPQFKTNIQGLDIHFIRVSPVVHPGKPVVPLLLLHGWPGSVREFYETIPLLTADRPDRDFVVEVIAPSLPGFGFSDAAARPGLSAEHMAVVLRNLMRRLGHKQFIVQGGDWGGFIGACMSTLFPKSCKENVKVIDTTTPRRPIGNLGHGDGKRVRITQICDVLGYHTNFGFSFTFKGLFLHVFGALFPPLVVEPKLAYRMYPLVQNLLFLLRESGYLHELATKPDTMGIGLSDSPAGLLTFIYQLISTGTRRYYYSREDGGLYHYPRSTLIDNVMMYWASNSITTSFRIYTESFNKQFNLFGVHTVPTKVPTWVLQAEHEVIYQSPKILKTKFTNLIHTTVLTDGGHFLAMEMPSLFAHDVLNSIQGFRKWHRKNRI